MNFKISGNLIFDNKPEHKIVWHISHIKNNDDEGWNFFQKRSMIQTKEWLKQKYPEMLI